MYGQIELPELDQKLEAAYDEVVHALDDLLRRLSSPTLEDMFVLLEKYDKGTIVALAVVGMYRALERRRDAEEQDDW